jgi:hypothetical protein
MAVALTSLEELRELFGAVQNPGPDAKETDAAGFTSAK